jgi:hypothetical protein
LITFVTFSLTRNEYFCNHNFNSNGEGETPDRPVAGTEAGEAKVYRARKADILGRGRTTAGRKAHHSKHAQGAWLTKGHDECLGFKGMLIPQQKQKFLREAATALSWLQT